MIKELISDLTFDKTSLSQALTRAKLIAYEIENEEFKRWISLELNGYNDQGEITSYRKILSDVFVVTEFFGSKKTQPLFITGEENDIQKEVRDKLETIYVAQSISSIEDNLKGATETHGYDELPHSFVLGVRELLGEDTIVGVKRKLQTSKLQNIINQTKQRLLDTLLELNSAFPELKDHYQNTPENKEKADTIINNYILAENSSSNIGVGSYVSQEIKNVYNHSLEAVLEDLRKLGVPDDEVKEVELIVKHEKDKKKLSQKLFTWTSKLATKVIEKGIELQLPEVIDKIKDLL